MTRRQVLALSLAAAAALVASLLLVIHQTGSVRVSASSGSDPSALLAGAARLGTSSAPHEPRKITWRTASETVGAWVELSYPKPTLVNHVEVLGPPSPSTGFTSAVLTFDGGASLMVTANKAGDAAVTFPGHKVSRVRLTIAGVPSRATSVALAGLSVDGSGNPVPEQRTSQHVMATTSSNTGEASALTDGRPAEGTTGAEWQAAPGDPGPWAELSWRSPREIASVQVFGPTNSDARSTPAAVQLHGQLRFDDGSTVVVSGISAGDGEATTIAFTPRMATSVRLDLERTLPGATVGLRELAVYDAGTTPPRWPRSGGGYMARPSPVTSCSASSTPVAAPVRGRLTLVCPSPGSAVEGTATVVVAASPRTPVQALVWTGASAGGADSVSVAASATAGPDGRAVLTVDTSKAPRGPLTLKVQVVKQDPGEPLYVQLVNLAGRFVRAAETAPKGMTLQWDEEFTTPLAISATGEGATYAASKPDPTGGAQFGEARFADPASGAGTLTTLDGGYLRIRTRPADDRGTDRTGKRHLSGLLSSAHVGGSGFAAQYGYFEARIMGAPGAGSWPAFWMLDTESATGRNDTTAEVDAVELYGHSTLGSCHTVHNWNSPESSNPNATGPSCIDPNGFSDWAMAWHTYGVRITPNGASFSIDGLRVSKVTGLSHSSEPFFFLLDLAVGGGWPVDLTPTAGITDMYVDWVHAFT